MPSSIVVTEQNVQKATNNNIEPSNYAHVEEIQNGTSKDEIVPTTPKQLRKIIEIQTVQTTCEKLPSATISQTKQLGTKTRNAVRTYYLETCL